MQWFKHESNANSDDKLQNILLDYGLEGYGLYWYCLELIVNRVDKDNITFELKHDARIIARNTGSTPQKVEEMMRRFVELGLFESSDGNITCLKLLKRLDSSMTSNVFMRELIANAKISHDGIMTSSRKPMQEEKRIEEIRREQIKKPTRTSALDDGFIEFYNSYPKKKNRIDAEKAWRKIKPPIDDVLKALEWQKQSDQWTKKGGEFIPYPASYINAGGWLDEPVNEGVPF